MTGPSPCLFSLVMAAAQGHPETKESLRDTRRWRGYPLAGTRRGIQRSGDADWDARAASAESWTSMKIKISRHARRRAKLYKIPESIISGALDNMVLAGGKHEIVREINGFKYPLKIVAMVEDNVITVITNYPLKRKYENSI